MAFNKEIEKVKAQIKVLEKNLSFLEEIEKQPKMTLANSGEFDVVSYNYKLYYRFEYPDSDNFSWYKTQDVPKGYVTGVFEPVTDAETERLLEGLYYNYIQVKKEKEQQTKSPAEEAYKDWWGEYPGDENWTSDATRWQGFQAGYNAAYEEKVSEEPEEQKWDAVRESVRWCEENPDKDPLDWLKPQTPEQTAQSLKEAFVEAQKTEKWKEIQKLIDEEDNDKNFKNSLDLIKEWGEKNKPKTLYQICMEWWDDTFTKKETSLQELVDRIDKEFIPPNSNSNDYQWNKCLELMRNKLR